MRDTQQRQPIRILKAGDSSALQFEEARRLLREKRSQWVYFDRNLRIYEGTSQIQQLVGAREMLKQHAA